MTRGLCCLLLCIGTLAGACGLSIDTHTHAGPSAPAAEVFQVTPVSSQVYSGPTPAGVAAMNRLADLGIRTIVSVDGSRPGVELARAAGLEYVHLPIGYDDVPPEAVAALTRVMWERKTPVFVHCHHGRHRGPAAAAIAAMIVGELDHSQALKFLEAAGTSPDYVGLWSAVESFAPLPAGIPLPELVSVAPVEPLAETMSRIAAYLDAMDDAANVSETVSAENSAEGRSAAVLLFEALREAGRLSPYRDPEYLRLMKSAEEQAARLAGPTNGSQASASEAVARLRKICTECHRVYRD